MKNMRLKPNEIGMRSRFQILALAPFRRNQPESDERIGEGLSAHFIENPIFLC